MSIELVIAALMAVVAILVGFASPAPRGEAVSRPDMRTRPTNAESGARKSEG